MLHLCRLVSFLLQQMHEIYNCYVPVSYYCIAVVIGACGLHIDGLG